MITVEAHHKPTPPEFDYARILDERFSLGLKLDFMGSRKKVRNLLHVFGFHNGLGEEYRKFTGFKVEETLRNGMENGLTDLEIMARLNNRVMGVSYSLEEELYDEGVYY